ncbi:specifically androgen-regulated gene protein-like isoform 1-T2 [Salvelinus alpinus]|uniref:specifically androgen-regulated gene protein-like n=1 Tax=Salvelinus alpinus TaxID=8036 RepID=UPI0039FCDE6D
MPKSDTWPGGVAMESLISMDSTGSCDSVVSMNSGFSDDSLEHLSAEERACLMFLESTIESLEMEEDSGLSNDEPDLSNLAAKPGHLSMGQTRLEDVSEIQHADSGRDQKSFLNCIVPTPLRMANSLASIQLKAPASATQSTAAAAAVEPRAPAPIVATQLNTPGAFTDLKPPGVVTEPTVSEVVTDRKAPEIATVPKSPELITDIKSPGLDTITKALELSTESKTPELAADPKASASDTTPSSATSDNSVDNMPKGVSVDSKSAKRQSKVHSELDLKLIPPPSDFRDDEPEEESEPPVPAELRVPLTYSELEQPRRRAPPASPGAQQVPPSKPVDLPVPVSTNSPPSHSEALTIPTPEALETKNPPAVAPKPKRLPSNIIQKSQKSDSHPGSPLPLPFDRLIIDPQKVRLEALRKLGLLKGEDGDSGPVVSPKSRKSWAPTPSPRSPAATQTQAPAQIPTTSPATTPGPVPATIHTPIPVPAAVAVPATTVQARATTLAPLPAPIQFSDNAKALLSPLATPPSPPKHIPPPIRVKSATLERSSMGQRSYMASNASLRANQAPSVPLSPRDQRNSRPRPASLGTGKDFMNVQGEVCHPQPGHGESQNKLPRSHGISVLICPNSKSGEDRREALKKLGLLSD